MRHFQLARVSAVLGVALLAALAIVYAALEFGSGVVDRNEGGVTYTTAKKTEILGSLAGTTTVDERKKASVLQSLSQKASPTASDETKLKLLEALRSN